jgi:hypothetical protein
LRSSGKQWFTILTAEFSISGGCHPELIPILPIIPDLCGDTVPVRWIVTDVCFIDSCEAVYIVEPGGSIGDYVWHDMNQNGIQDAGEPGIPNVGVHLSGDHTASVVTDAMGYYIFECLPAGTYNVTFDSPGPDYYESPANQGMDDEYDSDPIGGVVTGIILGIGEVNRSVDAGFFQQNNVFCSLTQGGYGNAGGKYCDQGTYHLIDSLLTAFGPLVVGIPMNNNTFTVPVNGAQCVIDILPGGGPNAVLSGNLGCGNFGNLLSLQGTLKNNLLAQSIVMQLNLWWNPDLGSFLLSSPEFYTVSSSDCANPGAYPMTDSMHYMIPLSVYNALGPVPTVQGILDLANEALGGNIVGPSLSDIQMAADLINNAFHECRFVYFIPQTKSNVEPVTTTLKSEIDLHIMPNPFESETDIQFSVPKDSRATVEIYNLLGAKVTNLYNDVVEANKVYTVKYIPTEATGSQILICVIRTDNGTAEKRMVLIR